MTDQLEMMPDEGKQDSPRLAWMKKMKHRGFEIEIDEDGNIHAVINKSCLATTEMEAMECLAESLGIPLWNEEALADRQILPNDA